MADIKAWLRAARVADTPADVGMLEALAVDMLPLVAEDVDNPRAFEMAAACELAIACYHSLAGDWTLADAIKQVKDQDAGTKFNQRAALADIRAAAKTSWGQAVAEVVVRVRAIRNLSAGVKKQRGGQVLPLRRAV